MFYRLDSEGEWFYITEIGGAVHKILTDRTGHVIASQSRKEMAEAVLMLNMAEKREEEKEKYV